MPSVLSFDDPAIVATLGHQASQFQVQQADRQYGLQLGQQQLQAAQIAAESRYRQQQLANSFTPPPQQAAAPQQPTSPGGTEITPSGATIYHPAGDGFWPQQQPAAGGHGSFAGQVSLAGGGYITPLQRHMGDTIDQMEQAGQLQPAEAARWRMQVLAGQNPFEQPTVAEQLQTKHKEDVLTQYQQLQLGQHDTAEQDRIAQQQAQQAQQD